MGVHHPSKNCYAGHGAQGIAGFDPAPQPLSIASCKLGSAGCERMWISLHVCLGTDMIFGCIEVEGREKLKDSATSGCSVLRLFLWAYVHVCTAHVAHSSACTT